MTGQTQPADAHVDIAEKLKTRVRELNALIGEANKLDLRVHIETVGIPRIDLPMQRAEIRITRTL